MPTYEYRCPEGHDFEKFTQKMSDAKSELPCPQCGAIAARRMSAGGGLVFKGSGFYITDYGKDGKKDQRAAAEKAGASDSANATSSPSEKTGSTGAAAAAGSAPPTSATPSAPAAAPAPVAKPAPSSDTSSKKSGPAQ